MVRAIPAATDKKEKPWENELKDNTKTSKLFQAVIDVPDITENDYTVDKDFADIYEYIKYDILTHGNAKKTTLNGWFLLYWEWRII